jgi:hypothetical protein
VNLRLANCKPLVLHRLISGNRPARLGVCAGSTGGGEAQAAVIQSVRADNDRYGAQAPTARIGQEPTVASRRVNDRSTIKLTFKDPFRELMVLPFEDTRRTTRQCGERRKRWLHASSPETSTSWASALNHCSLRSTQTDSTAARIFRGSRGTGRVTVAMKEIATTSGVNPWKCIALSP